MAPRVSLNRGEREPGNQVALRKICTNINQLYLIWAAVRNLSSCSSNQRTKDTGTHNRTNQGVDNKKIQLVHDDYSCSKVEDRSAN